MLCVVKPTTELGWIVATQKAEEAHRELAHNNEAWGDFFQSGYLAGFRRREQSHAKAAHVGEVHGGLENLEGTPIPPDNRTSLS